MEDLAVDRLVKVELYMTAFSYVKNKDNVGIDVRLRHSGLTIVAVEKQQVLHILGSFM